jgi:membrane fusion protein, heavy metal efflux system
MRLHLVVIASLLLAVGCQKPPAVAPVEKPADGSLTLSTEQLRSVQLGVVGAHDFSDSRNSIGVVDFDENRTVQISPPYAGRVLDIRVNAGDVVRRGQTLFVIESPDLVQAESTLIAAAGTLALTTESLHRAETLLPQEGVAEKDLEQAKSDQQAAEAAYRAALQAVTVFGKTGAESEDIVTTRHTDARMAVKSPLDGVVTARAAAIGTLVQPGATPAPVTVSDVHHKWLLASIAETDVPAVNIGQPADVQVLAYPDETFLGKVAAIGSALDATTRRLTVRIELPDPNDRLKPQMQASFTLHSGARTHGLSIPEAGLVREGDGSITAWVTQDGQHFTPRTVQVGMRSDGLAQVLTGLSAGERVVTDGAVFLSTARALSRD